MTSPLVGRVVATIPSPSSGAIHIGPLQLRAYGLMIALGVIAAVWLFGRRLERFGLGTRDDASSISVGAVIAGILGARLYHVITSWDDRFADNPLRIFKIWEGGLGIPGGLAAGIGVGAWLVKRRGIPLAPAVGAAAPALPLAQAIGRWGNWWNQELFGRPTKLPWALEVGDAAREAAGDFPPGTTFHPTFLYESLGNFLICGLLLLAERRFRIRPGRLMAWYLAGYALLRLGVESLRIDPAHVIGGLRLNTWVSLAVLAAALLYLFVDWRRWRGRDWWAEAEAKAAAARAADDGDPDDSADDAEAGDPGEPDDLGDVMADDDTDVAEVDEAVAGTIEAADEVEDVDASRTRDGEPAGDSVEPASGQGKAG